MAFVEPTLEHSSWPYSTVNSSGEEDSREGLRFGDQVLTDQRIRQAESLSALQDAVSKTANATVDMAIPSNWVPEEADRSIVEAWWTCMRSGCELDDDAIELGFLAHRRQSARARTAPITVSIDLAGSSDAHGRDRRITRLEALLEAVSRGDPEQIARAASDMMMHEGSVPVDLRMTVQRAEQKLAAYARAKEARERLDIPTFARSWAHLKTLWPDCPDESLDEAGILAFRAFGRQSRTTANINRKESVQ